ncbi:MAG TPA: tol-pal system protein YbgF [Methylomirabilota bacterium]|nr:tol-pal system protein YbgF [Methylomirabilota bacterium]
MIAPSNGRRLLAAATLALLAAPIAMSGAEAGWRSPAPAAPLPDARPILVQSSPEAAQQSLRIDRVEDQMRQLNGRIDELTYQIQQLQEVIRRSREDTEFRFQELQGGSPPKRSESPSEPSYRGETVITTGPADVPVELGSGFTMDTDAQYGQPPQVLGTVPEGSSGSVGGGPLDLSAIARGDGFGVAGPTVDDGFGATDPLLPSQLPDNVPRDVAVLGAGGGVQTSDLPPPGGAVPQETQVAAVVADDPRTLYDKAYGHVMAGEYEMAEQAFRRYLEGNDRSPMAGDANFWLGESLYARGEFRDAADAFLTTYRDYPASQKAPESLLKLGLSLEGLGETDAACATYREVEKKYASASGALLQQVSSQKSKAGC